MAKGINMTKDEALRIALEALEYQGPSWIEARQPAITAIKEALETKDEPVAWVVYSEKENDIVWTDKGKRLKQNTPLYTTTSQQEVKNETAQQRINKLPPNDSFERDEAARNIVREFMRNH